jgi:hypothetical protein
VLVGHLLAGVGYLGANLEHDALEIKLLFYGARKSWCIY